MKQDAIKAAYIFAFFVLFVVVGFALLKFSGITGAAQEEYGTLNFTVQESVSIKFNITNISFGSGYVEKDTGHAVLQTNGTVINGTWTPITNFMVLENDGNTNANVSVKATSDPDTFIGLGGNFSIKVEENLTGACLSSIQSTFRQIPTTYNDTFLCQVFNHTTGNNRINLQFRLIIPELTAESGTRENSIYVLATPA